MMIVIAGSNILSRLGPKVSEDFFKALEKENIIFDSGKIWVTFRAYDIKDRGIYISNSKSLHRGRFILTHKRLVAIISQRKVINIPKDNNLYKKIIIDKSNSKRYIIKVDLGNFKSKFTGNISLEYHIKPSLVRQ